MTAFPRRRRPGAADQPTWWASWAVRSAALPLGAEHRYGYRREFLAELYGMTPTEELHHAGGVLSRVWTLRVALTDPARLEPAEGQRYRECRGCGKQRIDVYKEGPGPCGTGRRERTASHNPPRGRRADASTRWSGWWA
jgi:hypothetical protein